MYSKFFAIERTGPPIGRPRKCRGRSGQGSGQVLEPQPTLARVGREGDTHLAVVDAADVGIEAAEAVDFDGDDAERNAVLRNHDRTL